jgi:glutaredoxin
MRRWFWLVALAVAVALPYREQIHDWISPPQPLALPAGTEVSLYSTATCPYCAKTRKLFKTLGVPYRDFDVDKSDEAFAQFQKLGGTGVPVVVIGERVIHGYDREEIEQALRSL